MPKFAGVAFMTAMLLLAVPSGFAKTPPAGQGTIVIVFKDGHRQSFNLSDISRVEFPVADEPAPASGDPVSRRHFLGKWEVGDGSGATFFITLYEDGTAKRSIGEERGKWVFVDGEAHVTWDDGWHDSIRKVGSSYQKCAYGVGKAFTDAPDNVTAAKNITPKPI